MDIHRTRDSTEFADAVLPFLSTDPVRNTVLLTVLDHERVERSTHSWFAWACGHDGDVVGAALRTPPYNVALSAMRPEVAAQLGVGDDSPGAVGARDVVEAFAGDRRFSTYMLQTQYVLTELIAPCSVPGEARRYEPQDADLYVSWLDAFVTEAGVTRSPDPLGALDRRLSSEGAMWIWQRDGERVALAGRSSLVCGVPRIGPVWTPPEHRGNGYAAALTAHVCADAFSVGATACTLFADAANATSNGVYLRLGFRPNGEIADIRFEASTVDVS